MRSGSDNQGALIELAYELGVGSRVAQGWSRAPLAARILVDAVKPLSERR